MVSPSRKRKSTNARRDVPSTSRKRTNTSGARDASIVSELTEWFRRGHRPLPFRRTRDAYAIWVSEIMLQQTQVKTVIPYFERWMARFPTVRALAEASEAEVLSTWQGLGYYSRGRNLKRAAQVILAEHAGRLPSDVTKLLALPGIGPYTAGAIASIAYDKLEPVVDGNVIRVLTRLDALRGDPRKRPLAGALWKRARELVVQSTPRLFNQALMELGALVCTPTKPQCTLCPLLAHCRGQASDLTDVLPEIAKRPRVEARNVWVFYAERKGRLFLLHQPSDAQHWAKLHTLPFIESPVKTPKEKLDIATAFLRTLHPKATLDSTEPLTQLTYPITRFRFHATAYAASIPESAKQGCYYAASELDELALPAPHRKLLRVLR